eukprot:TRINITY_DN6780_c0_g1_i3.p1 TRINITY_DN6780_c0_g1~~TRINITY_DN6780_c0_g1_i3.p1  ORF type:complete len:130 (+),score=26.08 TRINITY_DN6780_c0_g1_i3:96-485(+)
MGANCGQCQCDGAKGEETTKFTPRPTSDLVNAVEKKAPMQAPAAAALKAGGSPELQKLQGLWETDADGQLMGEVAGSVIVWDSVFNQERWVAGGVEMDLNSEIFKAKYEDPGKLIWSDGEVWVKRGTKQ